MQNVQARSGRGGWVATRCQPDGEALRIAAGPSRAACATARRRVRHCAATAPRPARMPLVCGPDDDQPGRLHWTESVLPVLARLVTTPRSARACPSACSSMWAWRQHPRQSLDDLHQIQQARLSAVFGPAGAIATRITNVSCGVRLGHSAMSVRCPVCPKADTTGRIYEYTPELDAARRSRALSRASSTARRAARRYWRGGY
jgi:hypothetical protein